MQIEANGISLEYETFGAHDNPTVVLIRGLGTQMIRWPRNLIDGIVSAGFHVVIFDNRDVGLSQKFEDPDLPSPAYSMGDMAQDVVGLLDALGIGKAHIFGISMGGMIAQVLASRHADRTLSLVSVMSSTNNPDLPPASEAAMKTLTPDPNAPMDRESILRRSVEGAKVIGSPGFPQTDDELYDAAAKSYDRCHHPAGIARQMAAIIAEGDRRGELARVTCPTLVIHGTADQLVPPEGGEDTAANIKGAELWPIDGMGHDIPPALADAMLERVVPFFKTAS